MPKLLLQSTPIKEPLKLTFSIKDEGWYLINVSARVKSEKQISKGGTDDQDLRVEIDNRTFPHLTNPTRFFDSPAAFSGGRLHNKEKTVYFILHVYPGDHTLLLTPDKEAEILSAEYNLLDIKDNQIIIPVNRQAEDGDRRPWITFTLVDLTLNSFTLTAVAQKRYRDSDDIKIIVDGQVKTHFEKEAERPPDPKPLEWFYRFWYFVGSILLGKQTTSHFKTNLSKGLHYLELWVDRKPTLKEVEFDLGEMPRFPTKTDPLWTGNFQEDSEVMLLARVILGEAEDQPHEAKIWVAGSIMNRVSAKVWPNTIHEVILQKDQYDPLKPTDPNYPKVIDPLRYVDEIIWRECYKIATDLFLGKLENSTEATHFHGRGITKEWFMQNVVPNGRFLKQIGETYFYWSPN